MKKIFALLLALLTVLMLFASCGKDENKAPKDPVDDPNSVLNDSDVPLDVGAEIFPESNEGVLVADDA